MVSKVCPRQCTVQSRFYAQALSPTLSQREREKRGRSSMNGFRKKTESTSMTRRRFYAPPANFALDEKSVTLSAEETRHARDVLRLQTGDEVFVFDGAGREFHCTVQTIKRDSTELSVLVQVEPARPESQLTVRLAIALLKVEKVDLVIQ